MSTKKTTPKTRRSAGPRSAAATPTTKLHPAVNIRWLTPEEAVEKYGAGFGFVGSRPIQPANTNPPSPTNHQGGK